MSQTRILAACSPGEVRVAVMRERRMLDYAIWRPGLPDGVGDIHRGRVTARMPAMAGAFVALADADGFLPDSEGAKDLTEGTILAVRVTRAAQGGKGSRLSAKGVGAEADGPIGLIRRGPGALERLAAAYPDAAVLVDDAAVALVIPAHRRTVIAEAFDDDVATQVEALGEPVVALAGGARLSIYPTPALVAIDTDSGGRLDSHLGVNRAIAPALGREIRLRNLSGAIVVDLAGMPIRKRGAVGPAIAAALAEDPLKPRFLGFSALGLAEILRPRVHPPLHEVLAGPHAAGLAALRAIVRDLDPDPRRLPALRAAPAVIEALQRDSVALGELQRRVGRALTVRSDPAMTGTDWRLELEHA
jgi:Ribonuclease G/E